MYIIETEKFEFIKSVISTKNIHNQFPTAKKNKKIVNQQKKSTKEINPNQFSPK